MLLCSVGENRGFYRIFCQAMAHDEKSLLKDVDELLSWVVEGDVIEIPTSESEGESSKWAIFIGKGNVIHVDRSNSQVTRSTLRIFCGNSLGRVNNFDYKAEGRISRTPLEIVKCAQRQVGKVTNLSPKDFVESCTFTTEPTLGVKQDGCKRYCFWCPCRKK